MVAVRDRAEPQDGGQYALHVAVTYNHPGAWTTTASHHHLVHAQRWSTLSSSSNPSTPTTVTPPATPRCTSLAPTQPAATNTSSSSGPSFNTAPYVRCRVGSTITTAQDPLARNSQGHTPLQSAILGALPGNLSTARTKFCEALSLLVTAGSPVHFTLPPPKGPSRTPIPPATFLEWTVAEMQDIGLLQVVLAAYSPPSDALRADLPRALCLARSVDVAKLLLSTAGAMPLDGTCVTHLLRLGLTGLSHELLAAAAARVDAASPAEAGAFVTSALGYVRNPYTSLALSTLQHTCTQWVAAWPRPGRSTQAVHPCARGGAAGVAAGPTATDARGGRCHQAGAACSMAAHWYGTVADGLHWYHYVHVAVALFTAHYSPLCVPQ